MAADGVIIHSHKPDGGIRGEIRAQAGDAQHVHQVERAGCRSQSRGADVGGAGGKLLDESFKSCQELPEGEHGRQPRGVFDDADLIQ